MGRTHEALRRAEANFQKRNFKEKQPLQKEQIRSSERFESQLKDLGLGKDQILNQNLKEIGQSLHQVDGYIASPTTSLNIKFNDFETDFNKDILLILIDRKKLILNRFNDLVSNRKYHKIKRLLRNVADEDIRTSIEKIINELHVKDRIIKKEHQKLEQLRLTVNNAQQQNLNDNSEEIHKKEPIDEKKEKPEKFHRIRNSLGILIMGLLLICLTFFIALAPFSDVPLPV